MPRRYSAFQYVAGNGYLPKDWDWAASSLSVKFPPLPHLVSLSMGGICDLITQGDPPLHRTAPNSADAPMVNPDANSLLHAASKLLNSPDRAAAHAEIRVPPATPKPPPPALTPSVHENAQATDDPSDYQSDWYGDWNYTNWKWQGALYRSACLFFCAFPSSLVSLEALSVFFGGEISAFFLRSAPSRSFGISLRPGALLAPGFTGLRGLSFMISPGRDLIGCVLIAPFPVALGLGMVTRPLVCLCARRRPEELALL